MCSLKLRKLPNRFAKLFLQVLESTMKIVQLYYIYFVTAKTKTTAVKYIPRAL